MSNPQKTSPCRDPELRANTCSSLSVGERARSVPLYGVNQQARLYFKAREIDEGTFRG